MLPRWRLQVGLTLAGAARDELHWDLRQVRRGGFHQQHIDHHDDHQAADHHKSAALRWLPRQVVDRRMLLQLMMTGPTPWKGWLSTDSSSTTVPPRSEQRSEEPSATMS